jgi:hypothetical protein
MALWFGPGRQTLTHGDLGLLISRRQLQHTIQALSFLGFKEVRRDDVRLVRLWCQAALVQSAQP